MTAIAPDSASRISNAYYKTDEEFMFACAEAMREEYQAIIGIKSRKSSNRIGVACCGRRSCGCRSIHGVRD
jgi:hypothetical protein